MKNVYYEKIYMDLEKFVKVLLIIIWKAEEL